MEGRAAPRLQVGARRTWTQACPIALRSKFEPSADTTTLEFMSVPTGALTLGTDPATIEVADRDLMLNIL